jgi:hypothetical protein
MSTITKITPVNATDGVLDRITHTDPIPIRNSDSTYTPALITNQIAYPNTSTSDHIFTISALFRETSLGMNNTSTVKSSAPVLLFMSDFKLISVCLSFLYMITS